MSPFRTDQGRVVTRPGPRARMRVFRLLCVVLTVAPPLAACGAQETETTEESVEQITVLVDGTDQETDQEDFESVTVRTEIGRAHV